MGFAFGGIRLIRELRLEYSERSVMGVRFGSRETTRPETVRLTPLGPK